MGIYVSVVGFQLASSCRARVNLLSVTLPFCIVYPAFDCWGVARSIAMSLGNQELPRTILVSSSTSFCEYYLVMKIFLQPFFFFCRFKKSICQLTAKRCALSTGYLPPGCLPRNSVDRLTDRSDMTSAVCINSTQLNSTLIVGVCQLLCLFGYHLFWILCRLWLKFPFSASIFFWLISCQKLFKALCGSQPAVPLSLDLRRVVFFISRLLVFAACVHFVLSADLIFPNCLPRSFFL